MRSASVIFWRKMPPRAPGAVPRRAAGVAGLGGRPGVGQPPDQVGEFFAAHPGQGGVTRVAAGAGSARSGVQVVPQQPRW